MTLNDNQKNMRLSYLGGAAGAFISGIVWILSGVLALIVSNQVSMFALFFGGMLIHPLGILIVKLFGRSGKHASENPLGKLALEITALLFIGLFIAFTVAKLQIAWFFPIMLLTIGGRYLVFSTLYGMRLYWFLGGLLIVSGVVSIQFQLPFYAGAFLGGFLEVIFAIIITIQLKDMDIVQV